MTWYRPGVGHGKLRLPAAVPNVDRKARACQFASERIRLREGRLTYHCGRNPDRIEDTMSYHCGRNSDSAHAIEFVLTKTIVLAKKALSVSMRCGKVVPNAV